MTTPSRLDCEAPHPGLLRDARRRLTRLEAEAREINAALSQCELREPPDAAERGIDPAGTANESLPGGVRRRSPPTVAGANRTDLQGFSREGEQGELAGPVELAHREAGHRHGPIGSGVKSVVSTHRRPVATSPRRRFRSRPARQRIGLSRCGRPNHMPRAVPAWLLSLAVHGGLVFLLGLLTIATARHEEPLLEASLLEGLDEPLEAIAEIEVELPAEVPLADAPSPVAAELETRSIEPLVPTATDDRASDKAVDSTFSDAFVGALGMAVGSGRGSGKGRQAGSKQPGTRFFGTATRADRIVFLVDNSNSMDDGRFETALLELGKSVDMLSPKQSFYVVFYSDAVYPMFHPSPASELVPATKKNKQKLRRWLATAEMCMGGRLVDAVRTVRDLEPQVVYLLSDGVIGDYPLRYLTESDGDRSSMVIHTIGMTVPNPEAANNLLAIARAHHGTFLPVGVSPLAHQIATRRPIRKNRHRGPVWGIKLPAR
ncbi:MAG: vWA domain-containing protein [Pirellulales bacterium]